MILKERYGPITVSHRPTSINVRLAMQFTDLHLPSSAMVCLNSGYRSHCACNCAIFLPYTFVVADDELIGTAVSVVGHIW